MIGSVEILKDDKNTIEIKINEADTSIGEVLVSVLNSDKTIEFAAYKKEHPFDKYITLKVKGKNPRKALKNAISYAIKTISDIKSSLSKVF